MYRLSEAEYFTVEELLSRFPIDNHTSIICEASQAEEHNEHTYVLGDLWIGAKNVFVMVTLLSKNGTSDRNSFTWELVSCFMLSCLRAA